MPGFRLHRLKGDKRNLWSVKVSANWRITFEFEKGDAYILDFGGLSLMETLRNKNRAPSHPGALLRQVVLPELGITQGEFADQLGVSRRTVSEILHERRPITPDMAIRLGKLLGNGAGLWLRMQQALDVWTLEQEGDYTHIQQLKAA